jgi:integrase
MANHQARTLTKFQGVYARTSEIKRNPRDGKPDVCYDITYKRDGKKIWEKIGWRSEGYTAQMANALRSERMMAARHGETFISDKDDDTPEAPVEVGRCLTFFDSWALYKDTWLRNLSRGECEDLHYQKHIGPRFADAPMDKINPLDLESFKQDLFAQNLSPATIKQILGNIRRVYNKLTEWEIYSGRIPTVNLKMPKINNARVRYLTPKEADELLKAIKRKSLQWWRIASISLHAGLRLSEILELIKGDIDFSAGVMHVRAGKNGARMANINSAVKPILQEISEGPPSALLFPSTTGGRSAQASMSFKRAVTELGYNDGVEDDRHKVVFHTLRHTYASWLAIEGVPLYTISKLMGHSTIIMTQRYAHLCPDTHREATEKIAAISQRI